MQLASFVHPDLVICRLTASSKKRLFETVSERIASQCDQLTALQIFEGLFARERLGSTGMGDGIAVPHCRIKEASTDCCAVVTLDEPMNYDAPDNKPVDILIFLVVSGEACQDHLDRLAAIAKSFSDPQYKSAIQQAKTSEELKSLIFKDS
jgi:nitrogen PTS system EIIA component